MKELIYKGKHYRSIKECCDDVGADYLRVLTYKKDHDVSPQEAVSHILENPEGREEINYWTEKEEEIVKNMLVAGISIKEIAKLIGRTETAVAWRIHSRDGFPEARKVKIDEKGKRRIKEATSNAELRAIAKEYGVSMATINYHRHGRKPSANKEREAQIRELAKDHTVKEMASQTGLSETYIRKIAEDCGIPLVGRPRRGWTEAEEAYLRENYGVIPHMKIAKVLKRDHHVVARKAKRMGLV